MRQLNPQILALARKWMAMVSRRGSESRAANCRPIAPIGDYASAHGTMLSFVSGSRAAAAAPHASATTEPKHVDSADLEEPLAENPTEPGRVGGWCRYVNSLIAAEVSSATRYFDLLVQWSPRATDRGILYELVEAPCKRTTGSARDLGELVRVAGPQARTAVLLNGNLNHDLDIQQTLRELRAELNLNSRVIVVAYSPYLSWLYRLANAVGLRQGDLPSTFLTGTDLRSFCKLSGFEIVRLRLTGYCPWPLAGVGHLLNALLPAVPLVRWLAFATVITVRPLGARSGTASLSIVIPARDERGNIEPALKRLPGFGDSPVEVIFVEGHSTDGTWDEIQRVLPLYQDRFRIAAYRQTGSGKSDAVRLGFKKARHEVLAILDAELTMPPELLPRFFEAWRHGLGDFINGSRLTYPMEGCAMRPLNRLGNVFFAKALSWVLDVRLGDTLCGTKLLSRSDYERFTAWREDFGDFDPFGDFELLFPAAALGLGIVDLPVRYRDRTYGSTNISRFRHGAMLLKMTAIGLLRIKLCARPRRSSGRPIYAPPWRQRTPLTARR